MTIELARYQFSSWARKGISNNIIEGDDLGAGTAVKIERPDVTVSMKLNGVDQGTIFSLIGPGDITGINNDMIVRTEPLNWITDTEPNYLAFIEFYDEDFPWRYTPAGHQAEKLRPWLCLLVLKEGEFERTNRQAPLPAIAAIKKEAFPPHTETHLWAHVHSNADIPEADLSVYEKFLLSLNRTVSTDPDKIFSRLISPRKLEPNTAYYAFLVPAFEAGRLAGLEQPTAGVIAQKASWGTNGLDGEMPIYHEWFFRTGIDADFESLVNLLEPRELDPELGIRKMDCSRPGFAKADDRLKEIPGTQPSVIGLEGALKSTSTQSFPMPLAPGNFQPELQKVVNLPEAIKADPKKDPIISVPLYGKAHAKQNAADKVTLDIAKTSWLHDLNKDPRTRVAAGFGARIIQAKQEDFMKKAWDQVQNVIEANKQIVGTSFNMSVAQAYLEKTFSVLPSSSLLAMANPLLKKVKGSPTTIYHLLGESALPAAVFSGAFRRMVRPKGPVARKLGSSAVWDYEKLVGDLNEGKVTASPPKETPAALFTTQDVADKVFPYRLPKWLLWLLKQNRLVLVGLLILIILLALLTGCFVLLGAAALIVASMPLINRLGERAAVAQNLLDPSEQLQSIGTIPSRPDFSLRLSGEEIQPPPTAGALGQDSVEGANFRLALTDLNARLAITAPEIKKGPLDLQNAYIKVGQAIDPQISFPLRLTFLVTMPPYISLAEPEKIFPAMAYPDFEEPMYKYLCEISTDLLLPNLQLIPQNTASLLKTNQKFIESYMVGLNHEMGRELLWREYPTDQRGTYFRQFWDVKGIVRPPEGKTAAETAEAYKDIKPIDTWLRGSGLGKHNNRDAQGDDNQLVLAIRGDLLKRYPNTLIFMQKAIADPDGGGDSKIDADLDAKEFAEQVKFPLYQAEIPPDIKFFGFDMTVEQAKGTQLTPGFADHLGWFFVIQEIPGEPRFGMDIESKAGAGSKTWDDLSWKNLPADLTFIKGAVRPTAPFSPTDNTPDKWGSSSANMAYILFQKPVMVAIHADEMLDF